MGGWAIGVGSVTGFKDIAARAMAADGSGNIFVTGTFSGALVLGAHVSPSRDSAIFVAKLDSGLSPVWAASSAEVSQYTYVEDIATDGKGGAYITGCYFGSQVSFGAHTLKQPAGASTSYTQAFVARIDGKGQWAWVRGATGDAGSCGQGVAVDSSGDAHITGTFSGSKANFGAVSLSSKGSSNLFVARIDGKGTWRRANAATGSGTYYYYGLTSAGIVVDSGGSAYITGIFEDKATFGTLTVTSSGNEDVFVARLDAKGAWSWVASAGGKGQDGGDHLALDAAGHLLVTGPVSSGQATFGAHSVKNQGSSAIFVASISKTGAWHWARAATGVATDARPTVAAYGKGDALVAGTFSPHKSTFGSFTLKSRGGDDLFVGRLDSTGAWRWARGAGAPFDDRACGVATDSGGTVYTAGHIGGSISAPVKATFGQRTVGGSGAQDLFVARQSGAGEFTRVRRYSAVSSGSDYGLGVARDSAGNIYVTGRFARKATFGATTLTSKAPDEVFVAKADRQGKWVWAVAGKTSRAFGHGVAVDDSGHVYVTGFFEGDTSASGGYRAFFGAHKVVASSAEREVFVARVDRAGKWAWATAAGSTFQDDGHDVEVDGAGNLWVTGCVAGGATFGGTTLSSRGSTDLFVARLDAGSGKWRWARGGGSAAADCGHDLVVDGAGAAHVTGRIGGAATFGARALKGRGGDDLVVAKIDRLGRWQWVAGGGGSGFDSGFGVARDSSGELVVAGSFHGAARFGAQTLTAQGSNDVLVGKLDSAGQWRWVVRGGGATFTHGKGVALDRVGNIHVAGYFYGAASFGSITLAGGGTTTPFVARLNPSGTWTAAWAPASSGSLGAAHAIAAGPGGNTVTAGGFFASARFGGATLQSLGKADIFVWHLP